MTKIFKSLILFSLSLLIVIMFFLLNFFKNISVSINKPQDYLLNTLYSVNKNNPYQNLKKINFIVLGLDKRDDALEKTQTTDTIMFVSLNLENQKINIISLPRDLWFYDINSKINEIYPLSVNQNNQILYIKEKFQKLAKAQNAGLKTISIASACVPWLR